MEDTMFRQFLTRQPAFISLFITLSLFIPALSHAAITISQLALEKGFVTFSLASASTNEIDIKNIVEDDINLKLSYSIIVFRKTGMLLPDERITNFYLRYIVKKDIINNGYKVLVYENEEARTRWFDSMDELLAFLLNVSSFRLLPIEKLDAVSDYFVETDQEIVSLELVPPLNIVFNLFGRWNYYSPKVRSKYFNSKGIRNE